MRKKLLLVFICILFLSIGTATTGNTSKNLSREEVLTRCFTSSKASVVESTLSCWAKLDDKYLSPKQLANEMDKILKQIQPEPGTILRTKQNDGNSLKEMVYAAKGNKSYTIAVESIKSGNKGETYAIIDLSIDKSSAELEIERKKLESIFNGRDKMKLTSCITGAIDGKLTNGQIREKTSKALKAINAKKIEGMELDGISSISGFTGDIGSYIMSNNKKVNVQIALRYSSYDDKTYIWIGSPLIPVEY